MAEHPHVEKSEIEKKSEVPQHVRKTYNNSAPSEYHCFENLVENLVALVKFGS